MNGEASSSLATPGPRPQQDGISGTNPRSIVRQAPPSASAFRTPSHHGRRAHPQQQAQQLFQQQQQQQLCRPDFDSPFGSPPPTTTKRQPPLSRQQQALPQYSYYRQTYDSPFASPPPTVQQPKSRPAPLVLDPQRPAPPPNSNSSNNNAEASSHSRSSHRHNHGGNNHSSHLPVMGQLFEAATRGMRDHASPGLLGGGMVRQTTNHQYDHRNLHATPALDHYNRNGDSHQASTLARSASQAGFLQKLGANIPEFKRRFFVLSPETNLYYYLSPNDTEPRGKVDLEGSTIKEIKEQPQDGRYRFVISWEGSKSSNINSSQQPRNPVVLEARSKEVGQEWMKYLEKERVSTLKDEVGRLTSETVAQKNQIRDLERQVENFRMVEKDRDGALDDARKWKAQFEQLDEALRLLTQRMRKPPETSPEDSSMFVDAGGLGEEKKEDMELGENGEPSDATPTKNNQSHKKRRSNLVDAALEDDSVQDIEELLQVPGTYFSALSNASQQQRESLKLASIEAATAVEDVHEANEKLEAMQKRMEKAEKHLTKLWEENCTIRKSLKQKKREKRVLVREVKALQQATKDLANEQPPPRGSPTQEREGERAMEDTLVGSDEERLIIELEDHVASSIRLHERLLAANDLVPDGFDIGTETELNTSIDCSELGTNHDLFNLGTISHGATFKIETSSVSDAGGRQSPLQPTSLQPKLMSLMDDDSQSDSEEDDVGVNEYQSITPSISSIGAEMGDPGDCGDSFASRSTFAPIAFGDTDSTPERPNPVLGLDEDDADDDYERQPSLCAASTQSTSSKSVVTDNGQATSRLVCPLADVVDARGASKSTFQTNDELSVYHLTFYSRKIGIQFQKAPPAPTKPKGLLTAAMTADLAEEQDGSGKTAAELRSVATISSLASGRSANNEEICPVSTPEDIVLVCGFDGFDIAGMNQRPKLGARLVAFDGVSVEIGHWTFDSIRKAIKARSRPLTLSFRNDFLTSQQRAILTKAVMDVDAKCPPPRQTIPYGVRQRPPSTTPSINSALSHETDHFVNEGDHLTLHIPEDDMSVTPSTVSSNCCQQRLASASGSVSTHYGRLRRLSTNSTSTHQSNFRSFSEAGSSISTSIAPLVANLMKGVSERNDEFTPQYLQRKPQSLRNTPQHQDFQSNLL